MTRNWGRNLLLCLAAGVLFTGCGSRTPPGAGAGQTAARLAAKKAVSPGDQLSRNMVSAVAANKPSTLPVQVKFELLNRPDIGQPLEVDLAIVPMSASVDRVSGKVEGEDGLELVDGAQIAPTDRPAEGVPIRHVVKLLPKRDGLFTVRAVVTVDAAGASSSESYSVPVIADSGASSPPGKSSSAGAAVAAVAAAPDPAARSQHTGAPAPTAAAQ